MRFVAALSLVIFAACQAEEPRQTAAEVTPPSSTTADAGVPSAAAAPAEVQGAFVVRKGGSEAYRETFHRTADRVTSTLVGPENQRRAEQVLSIRPDGTVASVEVKVYDGSNQITQQWVIRIEGGTAKIEGSEKGGAPQQASMDVPPDTIPVPVNDSIVSVEQILRHRTRVGGNRDQVSVLSFADGKPSVDNVTVTFTGTNQARIEGTGASVDVVTDGQGHIVSGRDEKQGVTIERVSQTN